MEKIHFGTQKLTTENCFECSLCFLNVKNMEILGETVNMANRGGKLLAFLDLFKPRGTQQICELFLFSEKLVFVLV